MNQTEIQTWTRENSFSFVNFFPKFMESGCVFSSAKSKKVWIGWGDVSRSDQPSAGFLSIYAPDFYLKDEKSWWIFKEFFQIDRPQLIEFLETHLRGKVIHPMEWEAADAILFREAFNDLKNQFRTGTLKKAVPVVFERATKNEYGFQALLLLNLLKNTEGFPLHLYGVWNQAEGILGATPELLFEKSEQVLSTLALAGTRLKSDPRGSLLEDPKEMDEHQFVIDGIASSLSGIGNLRIDPTSIVELPTLYHLMTPLTIEGVKVSFEEVVKRLHPTPALGAFPRNEGRAWLENFGTLIERYRFGAPFGVIPPDSNLQSYCVVAIRNIQWYYDLVYLGAGCGVIEASELDREWKEIQGKIYSVKKLFGMKL